MNFINIKGYEGLYKINSAGDIIRINRNIKSAPFHGIKTCFHKAGYAYVTLCKNGGMKKFLLHRLIAIHFISNTENKPHINHINGIKSDNRIENLEWCTRSENVTHAYMNGRNDFPLFKKHSAKLNQASVQDIRDKIKNGYSKRDLSEKYKVSLQTISNIHNYKTWAK